MSNTVNATPVLVCAEQFAQQEEICTCSILQPGSVVAIDMEGANLGRMGVVSVVQVATESHQIFVFDVLHVPKEHPMWGLLRSLLEDASIVKVIHDSRMDTDSLFFMFDIQMKNIHDTSCYNNVLTGSDDSIGLSNLLEQEHIAHNLLRNTNIYAKTPHFWLKRPFTAHMIQRASGDVAHLIALRALQLSHLCNDPSMLRAAESLSDEYSTLTRPMCATVVYVNQSTDIPQMIGYNGENIKRVAHALGILIYPRGQREFRHFTVFHPDKESLQSLLEEFDMQAVQTDVKFSTT